MWKALAVAGACALASGCGETAAPPDAASATTVAFSVPDMMCEHSCVPMVRETLAKQPGVKDVQVDLKHKTATVAVDERQFNADAAVAALVDLQFTHTKLLSDAVHTNVETSSPTPDQPVPSATSSSMGGVSG